MVTSLSSSIVKRSFKIGKMIASPMWRALKWSPGRPYTAQSRIVQDISLPREFAVPANNSIGLESEETYINALMREAAMSEDKTKLRELVKSMKNAVLLRMLPFHERAKSLASLHTSSMDHYEVTDFVRNLAVNAGFREVPQDELYSYLNGYDKVHRIEVSCGIGNVHAWIDGTPSRYVILVQNGLAQWYQKCTHLHTLMLANYLYPSSTDLVIYRMALLNLAGCGVYLYLAQSLPGGMWIFLLANGLAATAVRLSFRRQEIKFLRASMLERTASLLASQHLAI